jgi:AhpD family alkylhydroperoxidase
MQHLSGALAPKTKELIALGISVAIDCESCMQWHLEIHHHGRVRLRLTDRFDDGLAGTGHRHHRYWAAAKPSTFQVCA